MLVESVPALTATFGRVHKLPASTSVAASGMKRFASISKPSTTLIIGVLPLKPAKADPLFPPADVAA